MCKFHHNVALEVARRDDGSIDLAAFCINSVTLGTLFYIGHYVEELPGISGYDVNRLSSKKGQQAFRNSGLPYDPEGFSAYQAETIHVLKEQTRAIMDKHPECMASLQHLKTEQQAIDFINNAPDELYAGFDDLSTDVFKKKKHADKYQPLRLAAADYADVPGVQPILTECFKQSVATTFCEAPEKANPAALWVHEQLKPVADTVYNVMPSWAKKFNTWAGGLCTVGGANVLYHGIHYSAVPLLDHAADLTAASIAGVAIPNAVTYAVNALSVAGSETLNCISDHPMTKVSRSILWGAAVAGSLLAEPLNDFIHNFTHKDGEVLIEQSHFMRNGQDFLVIKERKCLAKPNTNGVLEYTYTDMRADTLQYNHDEPERIINDALLLK